MAELRAKVSESENAFFVVVSPVPLTNPIISGTDDKAQGVNDVNMPAARASTGANHVLFVIKDDNVFSQESIIYSTPISARISRISSSVSPP